MKMVLQRTTSMHVPAKPSLGMMPHDLLLDIAAFCDTRADVRSLGLTSTSMYNRIGPALYHTVVLSTPAQCINTLGMLQRTPTLSRHVRSLVVRLGTSTAVSITGVSISHAGIASGEVRKTASMMGLDALSSFEWDADEMPIQDDMWFALRMGCPRLRYITTSFGVSLPSPYSHLFDFSDLLGFTAILKSGFISNEADIFLDGNFAGTTGLWDMLVKRSPNLRSLTIDGPAPGWIDAYIFGKAQWPELRALNLGAITFSIDRNLPEPEKHPLVSFIEGHPKLTQLHISRPHLRPHHLGTLDPGALANVTSFSGTLDQLSALPQLHGQLTSVTFRDTLLTRELAPQAVAGALQRLTKLDELKVSFVMHSMYDSSSLLRTLIVACPQIRHLELSCKHRPSFHLEGFAQSIRSFPRLRSLSLTIVRYPGDARLEVGATQIAAANPRLSNFSLTFLRPTPSGTTLPNYLILPPIWNLLVKAWPTAERAVGRYETTCDRYGLPIRLEGVEATMRAPGSLFFGRARTRRLAVELGVKKTARGFLGLLMERSSAGEELRLLVFSLVLVGLSFWGFVGNM